MTRPPGRLSPGGAGPTLRTRPPQETNAPDQPRASSRSAVTNTPIPERANGLQLLGRFERSGHRDAPSLVRRQDGQVIQLTPLLYAVMESIDGHRRLDQIAAIAGERTGKIITEDDVRFLIDNKLRPLGLLRSLDGSDPELRKANPLLGLRFRVVMSNPKITSRIAAPFTKLFTPPVALATTLAFVMLVGWLFFERGIAGAVRQSLYQPAFLLLLFALTTLSAAFHELGHAAALAYSGGRPGVMGAGLYLVWPAFYTDVTDAYRLERRARLRVDLGGIYFNALFALLAFGLWAATGWEALLAVIPIQLLQMVRQLVPLVRLDGYHILADLTGVPDLFAHIKPILVGMLPTNWGRSQNKTLKPWVRFVVTGWVLAVVPLLIGMLAIIVITLPRIAATAWDSLGLQTADLSAAWAGGDIAEAAVHALAVVAISVPLLSMVYLVGRVVRRVSIKTWRSTEGRPVLRGIAIVLAAAILAGLATAWWPNGQYTPIQAGERGRLADVLSAKPLLPNEPPSALEPAAASITAPDPSDVAGPTGIPSDSTAKDTRDPAAKVALVYPDTGYRFTLPEAPGEGDNQALAVNYDGGTSVIAMAVSLIFADGNEVLNSNEAYALASCIQCLAAAIAFQLIVVMDEADVIVPENTAVSIGAFCVQCVTFSLATQLIVALGEPLSEEAQAELERLFDRLEKLEKRADKIPLDKLLAQLDKIKAQVVAVLEEEGATFLDPSPETEDESQGEVTPTPEATTSEPSPSAGSSTTAEPSPTPSSDPSPTAEPSPTSDPSSAEPSPDPTTEP